MIEKCLHCNFICICGTGILMHAVQHLNLSCVCKLQCLFWHPLRESTAQIISQGAEFRRRCVRGLVEVAHCHSLPMTKISLEVLFLSFFELLSVVFYLFGAIIREMFITLFELLFIFFLLSFDVLILTLLVRCHKVLLHKLLDHFLAEVILPQLIRDKLRKLLLL